MAMRTGETGDAKTPIQRIAGPLAEFLHDEAAGGAALVVATVVALIWANAEPGAYAWVWDQTLDSEPVLRRCISTCAIG